MMDSPKILRFVSVSNFLNSHINELTRTDTYGREFLNLRLCSIPASLTGFEVIPYQYTSSLDSLFTSFFTGAPHNTQFKLIVWIYECGNIRKEVVEDKSEINPFDTFDRYIELKLANVSKGLPIVGFWVSFEDGNPRHTWLIITS